MKATLIISVYKNCLDLKEILDALLLQSEKDFEIIVSEDCQSNEIKSCIKPYIDKFLMLHLTQEDKGFRKNRALNRAIKAAKSDYLIFIDGDCVPHYKFIEEHIKNAEEKKILIGRRSMLGQLLSKKLRKINNIKKFSQTYVFNFLTLKKDKGSFFEEGIYTFLGKYRKARGILGCNFSCSKQAMYDINGFDEDYENPALGEDSDIDWRFQARGYGLKSVRNLAIVYHLDHKALEHNKNKELFAKKVALGQSRCLHGLENLE